MIYICEGIAGYSDEQYQNHLTSIPAWRREKALQYKNLDDRKRSVLAFVLLQRALREEYGISEIPAFVYNDFGKPSFSILPIHFSISHCKDAVVCAVSDHNIGIDVESIVPFNLEVARRVCTAQEFERLCQSESKDVDFIKLWTTKEAIAKYEGMGLSLSFAEINVNQYSLNSLYTESNNAIMTVCCSITPNFPPNNCIRPSLIIKQIRASKVASFL